MSQNDMTIANQGFAAFRSDLNLALQALASLSSGATEPTVTYAHQAWYDTTSDLLKMRSGDNTSWITLAYFDQTAGTWQIRTPVVQAVDTNGIILKDNTGASLLTIKSGVCTIHGTAAIKLPTGTTAERPVTPEEGMIRRNSETGAFEGYTGTEWGDLGGASALLNKAEDLSTRAFELSGSTLQTAQAITVDGTSYAASTAVTLPTLASHTDYLIYHTASGLTAQPWDDAAPASSIMVGGFHAYHTGATINPDSIWDLTYRPSCSPRAMTQCPTGEWVDIYLMDIDYGINGYSRGGVTIADDLSPPKIPVPYGGNGTTTYGSLTWFEAVDLAAAAGKRLLTYASFTAAAYGVVEQQAVGTDPVTTKYQVGYRSACGLEQVTGCMWQWGEDIQGNAGTVWNAITDGRGSVYTGGITAVLLGADWTVGSSAGSRASYWNFAPSNSSGVISSRASCAHMNL